MIVRANLSYLKTWINDRLADLTSGKTPDPEKTFAYYWMKNAGDGENFAHQDVVFECFHNFVAFSQWGNTIYNIMLKLGADGDPGARTWFRKTMESDFDHANGAPFTPLERFVMELFRTISPNGGSISALAELRTPLFERHGYMVTPHAATSFDPIQWKNPEAFDPERYGTVPTSAEIDEAKCQQIGLARCPFDRTQFEVKDGRKAVLHNSGFGTVYGRGQGDAGVRSRGVRAVRFRLSPLPGRAAHHSGVRRLAEKGVEGADRVRQARHRQSGAVAHRADHRHRRQRRVQEDGVASQAASGRNVFFWPDPVVATFSQNIR
jgi:hypothetical protein